MPILLIQIILYRAWKLSYLKKYTKNHIENITEKQIGECIEKDIERGGKEKARENLIRRGIRSTCTKSICTRSHLQGT